MLDLFFNMCAFLTLIGLSPILILLSTSPKLSYGCPGYSRTVRSVLPRFGSCLIMLQPEKCWFLVVKSTCKLFNSVIIYSGTTFALLSPSGVSDAFFFFYNATKQCIVTLYIVYIVATENKTHAICSGSRVFSRLRLVVWNKRQFCLQWHISSWTHPQGLCVSRFLFGIKGTGLVAGVSQLCPCHRGGQSIGSLNGLFNTLPTLLKCFDHRTAYGAFLHGLSCSPWLALRS